MAEKPYVPAPAADFVLPFDLPAVGLRGRFVRLDLTASQALAAHMLPEAASRVLAETLGLSALLGSTLKLDGRLTVQTKSDGPLDLVTVDYRGAENGQPAGLRGYARLNKERFEKLPTPILFEKLAGDGALAITIEPRDGDQTYQGVVELSDSGMAASAETYFSQSEQLPTVMRLAATPVYTPGETSPRWRVGGIMLQATPEGRRDNDDDWERLTLFLDTVEPFEMVDTELKAEDLLWRLFNEDEVRVLPHEPLVFRCDCEAGRIKGVLESYSEEDRAGLADPDGVIRARCEFCGTVHEVRF